MADALASGARGRDGTLVLLAVAATAINLRGVVTILSPIADRVRADIPFDSVTFGMIGSLPQLLFAGAGFVTPLLLRRLPLDVLAALTMFVGCVAQLLRPLGDSVVLFFAATALAFLGIGIGNIIMPPLVKRYFPHRIAGMTTLYSTLMGVSTTIPPLYVVGMAQAYGWRRAMASWALPAALACLLWCAVAVRRRQIGTAAADAVDAPPAVDDSAQRLRLWRSGQVWGITGIMAIQSMIVYTMFAWLPSLLRDAGLDEALAAAYLGLFSLLGIFMPLIISPLTERMRRLHPLVIVSTVLFVIGLVGLMVAPATGTAVWVTAVGLGPLTFSLVLNLINLRSRTQAGSAQLSSFVQGGGYLLAFAGPMAFGVLHQITGGWVWPLALMLAVALSSMLCGALGLREGFIEDDPLLRD